MQYCSSGPYNVKGIHHASSFGGKNLHVAWEQWLTSSKYCVIYRQQHQGLTQRSLPIGTPTNIVKECSLQNPRELLMRSKWNDSNRFLCWVGPGTLYITQTIKKKVFQVGVSDFKSICLRCSKWGHYPHEIRVGVSVFKKVNYPVDNILYWLQVKIAIFWIYWVI